MKSKMIWRACASTAAGALVVAAAIVGGTAAQAAPVDTDGVALQVALNAGLDAPIGTVVNANATVAAAYGPPSSSVTAVDIAAALAGRTGLSAANGTASASATTTTAAHTGTSSIDGLALSVLGSPTSATVLSGTATCPAVGTPTADTTVTDLNVLGHAVTATVNGPAVDVTAAVAIPGVTDATVTASVQTNVRTATATTATATALTIDLTLTGDVAGLPVSVPVGTITAGEATCTRPALVAPTETGLTPTSGPTAGGTVVTVTGTGFVAGATTVTIGGTTIPAGDVTVTDSTTLTFTTPSHAAGPVDVTTTTAGGTSTAQTYTYVPPVITAPTATGLNPDHGPTTGGTSVTVTGTGFTPGATVSVDGGPAITPTNVAADGTTLTFTTPTHTAGGVPVTVTTAGGVTDPQTFTYDPASGTVVAPPVITSPADGSTVTTGTPPITGTGTPGDTVTVNEGTTPICTAVVQANGQWTCEPDAPLGDGGHTITATQDGPDGTSAPSAPVHFTVVNARAGNGGTGGNSGAGSGTVVTAADGSSLAYTGSTPVTPGLVLAALFLALGVTATLFGRRKFRTMQKSPIEE